MPGDFHYLDENGIVVSTYWGVISLDDILDTIMHRMSEMPVHHPKVSVVDLSHAKYDELPPKLDHDQIERLRPAFAPPKVRTVLIAPGDYFFGFARMYSLLHRIYGAANVDVVRSWEAAAQTLGLDLTAARTWTNDRVAQEETRDSTETARITKAG